jgi:hypothetical protein
MAQGNLIVGGAGASAGGSKVQINHLSAGRIPEGASVEASVPTPLLEGNSIQLGLNAADFNTARSVAQAINTAKGAGVAMARDGSTLLGRVQNDAEETGQGLRWWTRGDTTMRAGFIRLMSSSVISSLRWTATSSPSSPKYCTRL